MSLSGHQPTDVRLTIPRRCLSVWAEVRFSIAARLSQTRATPMDEITQALIVEELLRIAVHHIYDEGYPSSDDVKVKLERRRQQLHAMADMADTIETMGKRLAALEGREGAADDS